MRLSQQARKNAKAQAGKESFFCRKKGGELALQSSTRTTLAPRISLDVPTSGAPEHSTPRKLACALPFYVDNPDASARAKWWVKHTHSSGACAFGAHSGVCARARVRTRCSSRQNSSHGQVYRVSRKADMNMNEIDQVEARELISAWGEGLRDDHRCALQGALTSFANVMELTLSTPGATKEITCAFTNCVKRVEAYYLNAPLRLALNRELNKKLMEDLAKRQILTMFETLMAPMEGYAKRQILAMFETLMAPIDDVAISQFNDVVTSMCARHDGAHVVKGHSDKVSSVCVTADGAHVVTGSNDNTARVWRLKDGKHVCTLEGHSDWVTSVCVTADGAHVVTGSKDKTARVWRLKDGKHVRTLEGEGDSPVTSVCVTADGAHVVTGSDDGTARVWRLDDSAHERLKDGKHVRTLVGHSEGVTSVCVTADGEHMVTGSKDKTARIYSTRTWLLQRSS